ncbi:MAG: HAD family hydrolase [Candidatus Kaiserbacteria bacterium]|nr:MAG: HAD family hydrolase [Candidatus Kaiserbacteria bacterium]
MVQVVVFDFDGVIVPSETLKQEAFKRIFSDFGEQVPETESDAARQEFSEARGNRFDIIRSTLKRLGRESEDAVQRYAERYDAITRNEILQLGVLPEVRNVLERLSKKYPLYINSNNPDGALERTVSELGIAQYFKAFLGSSHSKRENLASIAQRERVNGSEIVFVGDGEGDRRAAEIFGCRFIGIGDAVDEWNGRGFTVVRSVSEIEPHL